MLGSLVFNGPHYASSNIKYTDIYGLDIHLDIQLNIRLDTHHVLYAFGVCVYVYIVY